MISKLLLIVLVLLVSRTLDAQQAASAPAKLEWTALPDLPNELGVAGPFVGVHNDALIVAGGANFNRPVWDNPKVWVDEIWILTKLGTELTWRKGGKLPRPMAYGASVSTAMGIICVGGNDQLQNYRDVFLLQWDASLQIITIKSLPPLPSPCAFGQATVIRNVIYVAGGQRGLQLDSAMNNFWSLNLDNQLDPEVFKWREHTPLPFHPRAFNITAHQYNGDQDCVYVLGGRHQIDGSVRFLKDVWEFNPDTESWRQRTDMPRAVTAGTGIGFGQRQIFVLGGDDGSLFSKTEELKDRHPGFRKEAYVYDTVADSWNSIGATPQNQVATIPVMWDNRIIISSGEIRPRVRTPAIWAIEQSAQ
jgi:solute:Na+ symporter, SSS family